MYYSNEGKDGGMEIQRWVKGDRCEKDGKFPKIKHM